MGVVNPAPSIMPQDYPCDRRTYSDVTPLQTITLSLSQRLQPAPKLTKQIVPFETSFRALSGRLKFPVRLHTFNKDHLRLKDISASVGHENKQIMLKNVDSLLHGITPDQENTSNIPEIISERSGEGLGR